MNKYAILLVIFALLLLFYFVISLSVRKKNKSLQSIEIKNYLFNVRALITLIGVVALILWFFL